MGGQENHLTVSEVATALGTSPQTVRALLRSGQLRGVQVPWGRRYVWGVDPSGLDEFLVQFGRLDGGRRSRRSAPTPIAAQTVGPERSGSVSPTAVAAPQVDAPGQAAGAPDVEFEERARRRPWVLRPRGRAAVLLVVLLLPLLAVHGAAQVLPNAWWFAEVGQGDVFRRTVEAKLELRLLVGGIAAGFIWLNLVVAGRDTWLERQRSGALVTCATAFVIGTLFASSAGRHWESYLLWRHPQIVGVADPVHGKDVGFFLFSLPFELVMSGMLLWLIGVAIVVVALLHLATGDLRVRPVRASLSVQIHLALLGSLFMLAASRRLFLQRYLLELRPGNDQGSFAGAHYVDVHVRTPVLSTLVVVTVVLALMIPGLPFALRKTWSRNTRRVVWSIGVLSAVAAAFALMLLPALVQRFAVEPDPIASESPYVASSAVATQQALGLDRIDAEPYSPSSEVQADSFRSVDEHLRQVTTWDSAFLGSRMRQLVTDTPYYSPQSPDLDVVRVGGVRQPTIVGARELDTSAGGIDTDGWGSDRLAYTHGMGLIRFSGTDVGPDREPVLLDAGSGLREPRIYFGDLNSSDGTSSSEAGSGVLASVATDGLANSPWVLVNTRRPEVDVSSAHVTSRPPYHYTGPAGISLSSGIRRVILALGMGSKQVLLSDDVTDQSRMLLHRDVHDRLRTLAPFLDWDAQSFPLTVDGHIVFVVDGYTTSRDYPFAQRVNLGGSLVNYARASVRATVDAFTGEVRMYVTDPSDPLIRSWSASFPTLFTPADQMPPALSRRGRYPPELFAAQATAYERFHTDDPDTLAAESDEWSRPIALSGPLEVAGGVDFDESDEDDLRLTLPPGYFFASPPGHSDAPARLLLKTYYTPQRGQNLVATLTGWVDRLGRPHLTSRSLSRDPVVLGPAQISRLVFATPRVRNLLGLRNLEIRDLETSSLDSVYLGVPHLLLLAEGPVQVQSLFEGSRGPGAARLLGVTVFINGRAGLGPDVTSALRQAMNSPPVVQLPRPHGVLSVGTPVALRFRVGNARREDVTISWGRRQRHERLHVTNGRGTVRWTPRTSGPVRVRVSVRGLDGTTVTDATSFTVLSRPPVIRLVRAPQEVETGHPVRIVFSLSHGRRAYARVSTKAGIVFQRRYLLDDHVGVLEWTPEAPGQADVLLQARGRQGQTARASLRLHVRPSSAPAPPTVSVLQAPGELTVGGSANFMLSANGCRTVEARIRGADNDTKVWTWPCPASRAAFTWVPRARGRYTLSVVATSAEGLTASQSVGLRVRASGAGSPS